MSYVDLLNVDFCRFRVIYVTDRVVWGLYNKHEQNSRNMNGMDTITIEQVHVLYTWSIISARDCAYIFNIAEKSIPAKFYRLKKGQLVRKHLWPGEKKRLLEVLEQPFNAINDVMSKAETQIES